MKSSRAQLGCLSLWLLAACSTNTDQPTDHNEQPSSASDGGGASAHPDAAPSTGAGGATGSVDAGDKATSDGRGLPCDVAAVFDTHCAECHGSTPAYGAPFSLVTRDDLLSPVADQGGKPRLEVALARVQNDATPMPPAPNARLTAAEIATLQAWQSAGTPASSDTCQTVTATDGGTLVGVDLPKPDDCAETYELKAHGGTGADDTTEFNVSADPTLQGNEYYCFYFDPPYASDQGMYWFQSILDNTSILHHWILYGTDNKTHQGGTSAGCNATEAGAYFIAGWAPGATNGSASPDVVLDMPTGPKAGLILEVHYFNNTQAGQTDGSGIRFCTGSKTGRPHQAAVHTLGSEGICISPGDTKDVVGECQPRTDMGDVHITGVWPHMHKIGRNMKVTIKRKDGTADVIHDDAFDFNSQVFYAMGTDTVVHPGDTVETTCTYTNDTGALVHYGERTQDEMCYAFIPAWPAGGLATASNSASGVGNRCANDLSILQSCNGLADRPMNVNTP